MNPCEEYQESISLLASGSLDEQETAAVRAHLAGCAACREYYESMRALCGDLHALAQELPPAAALPAGFDRRLARIIRKKRGLGTALRVAVAAAACVLVAVAGWQYGLREHHTRPATPPVGPKAQGVAATPAAARDDLLPTYDTYRRAACESIESLNSVLDKHAARYLQPSRQEQTPMAGFGMFGLEFTPGELR